METFWFCAVSMMIALYVVFDGFDLGAGILHLIVARTDSERRIVLRSIGPVWDGNEVWLLASGGVLYFAFPDVYASSFSGFYLPLMMVLWLLIVRAMSIELRNHIESPLWQPVWDVGFAVSSALLAIFFGAALGNVVRGVPLDAHGRFFEPLWTDFRVGAPTGILDWFTVVIGVAAFVMLAHHGARWLVHKTDGLVAERARVAADRLWWAVAVLMAVVTIATFAVQPRVSARVLTVSWGLVFPALAIVSLIAVRGFAGREQAGRAFLASGCLLIGMLASAAFGLYPALLPALDAGRSLTVANAAAPAYGLRVGLNWWIPGMLLVAVYVTTVYRLFRGKVVAESEGY